LTAYVDKNTTKKIWGIPIKFTDLEEIKIDFSKINNKIKMLDMKNLVKEEIKRISSIKVNLLQNFDETKTRIHYIYFLDIFSELGGMVASVNSVFAQFAFIFLISYFYNLSSMIKRKYQNKIDIQ
jgi:hypothetical protein